MKELFMWRRVIIITLMMLVTFSSIEFFLLLSKAEFTKTTVVAHASAATQIPVGSAGITTVSPVSNDPASSGDNNTIVNTIITAISVIIAALITASATIFVVIDSKRKRASSENKPPGTKDTQQINDEEYIQRYREALLKDTYITNLQILGMKRPVPIKDIYVALRLSQENKLQEEFLSEPKYDPTALLQASLQNIYIRARQALEPEKAIGGCRDKRCIILGDPGAGKTTLLKYLAIRSANDNLSEIPNLPIYIDLHTFVNSGKNNLLDFASAEWNEKYGIPKEKALQCMQDKLSLGLAFLLLDGLDATLVGDTTSAAEASYKRASDAIKQIVTRYYHSPIVITARKPAYRQQTSLAGFTEMDVLEFQPEDIKKFVNNWFGNSDLQSQENARNINKAIEQKLRIQTLTTNPLLLTLTLIFYEQNSYLPESRARLYKECVEILLNKWDADPERRIQHQREFSIEHRERLLEDVAWHFHIKGRQYFPKEELLEIIEYYLQNVVIEEKQSLSYKPIKDQKNRFLDEIAIENGLLKEQANGWYGFFHLTLQEYFVAQKVVLDHSKFDTLLKHSDELWWEEVLLLYAGYTRDISSLLHKLLTPDSDAPSPEDIFHSKLLLAGRCMAATIQKPPVQLRDITSRLFDILQATPYSLTRQETINVLVEIGGKDITMAFIDILSNGKVSKDTGLNVATSLRHIRNRTATESLLPLLYESRIDRDIRKLIAEAIGILGDGTYVKDLLPLLRNCDIDSDIRIGITNALGTMGDTNLEEGSLLISGLLQLLSDDQVDISVREHIADVLGKIGDPTLAPLLFNKLSLYELNPNIRARIAKALGQLRNFSVVPGLLKLLSDGRIDQIVRVNIADALGCIGNNTTASALLGIIVHMQNEPEVQGHIALSIGKIGDTSACPILLKILSNEQINPVIGQSIIVTLKSLSADTLAPTLLQLLTNQNIHQDIRICAAHVLGVLGDSLLSLELFRHLSDTQIDISIREALADALGVLGERSITPKLLNLLSDTNVDLSIRGHIAATLGLLGERRAGNLLYNLLLEVKLDSHIRVLIADSLSSLGDRTFISELILLLADVTISKDVRKQVANTITQLANGESTVFSLAESLHTSDIADDIHQALWTISRRVGVRVFISDSAKDKIPIIVPLHTYIS